MKFEKPEQILEGFEVYSINGDMRCFIPTLVNQGGWVMGLYRYGQMMKRDAPEQIQRDQAAPNGLLGANLVQHIPSENMLTMIPDFYYDSFVEYIGDAFKVVREEIAHMQTKLGRDDLAAGEIGERLIELAYTLDALVNAQAEIGALDSGVAMSNNEGRHGNDYHVINRNRKEANERGGS